MRKRRILLVVFAALALTIAGAVVYVLLNINPLVKGAIEKYGSRATKTEVRVSSVDIRLSSGEGSIAGLAVANPDGFKAPNIFRLGNISVRIDAKTISKSPVVLQEIRISSPEVFYEMNSSGTSNLDLLKKNLQLPESGTKPKTEKKSGEKAVRIYIRKLVFEDGRVEARAAALGERPIMLNLPRLELFEIGKNGGATPTEAAKIVITALAQETAKVVARSEGQKYLRKGAEGLLERYLGK